MSVHATPRRRPLSRRARIITLAIVGGAALLVAVLLLAGQHQQTGTGGTTQGSDAVKQLDAEMYVTSQRYEQDIQTGQQAQADADRQTLLTDCQTARTLGLGQDTQSQAIRGVCQTLGSPVP